MGPDLTDTVSQVMRSMILTPGAIRNLKPGVVMELSCGGDEDRQFVKITGNQAGGVKVTETNIPDLRGRETLSP